MEPNYQCLLYIIPRDPFNSACILSKIVSIIDYYITKYPETYKLKKTNNYLKISVGLEFGSSFPRSSSSESFMRLQSTYELGCNFPKASLELEKLLQDDSLTWLL
jgi:hypothetical protein